MTSLREQAVSGVMWSAASKWAVRLTTAGAFVIVGRQLQPEDFGLVALASAFIGILTLVADLGFADYLVRSDRRDTAQPSTAFWISMALSTFFALAMVAAAVPMEHLFDTPGLAPVAMVLSLALIFSGLSSVQSALLRRDMQFKVLAKRAVFANWASSAVAVTLALAGAGVWALVAQSVVRGAVSTAMLWTVSTWRPSRHFDRDEARPMLKYGVNVLGVNVVSNSRDKVESFVIAAAAGPAALGVWTVARRILSIIMEVCVSVIAGVATPTFAKVKNDRKRLFTAFESSLALSAAVVFPALITLTVVSKDLIPAVFGEQWLGSAGIAQIMALTAVAATLVNYDRSLFYAVGRPGVELAITSVIIVTHLLIVVATVQFGLTVLAWVLAARAFATIPFRFYFLRRITGIGLAAYRRVMRVVTASTLSAAAMFAVQLAVPDAGRWTTILLTVVAGGLTYAAAMLLLAREMLDELRRDLTGALRRGRTDAVVEPDPVAS